MKDPQTMTFDGTNGPVTLEVEVHKHFGIAEYYWVGGYYTVIHLPTGFRLHHDRLYAVRTIKRARELCRKLNRIEGVETADPSEALRQAVFEVVKEYVE